MVVVVGYYHDQQEERKGREGKGREGKGSESELMKEGGGFEEGGKAWWVVCLVLIHYKYSPSTTKLYGWIAVLSGR